MEIVPVAMIEELEIEFKIDLIVWKFKSSNSDLTTSI